MKKHLQATLLILLLALTGCTRYPKHHIDSHANVLGSKEAYTEAGITFETVTMQVGEERLFTTPAKSLLPPPQYTLSVLTEDPSIAVALPVKGDFAKGTRIQALRPGTTRAIYGNAYVLHRPNADSSRFFEHSDHKKGPFMIQVIHPESP